MGERCDVGKHRRCCCQCEDKFSTLGLHIKGGKKKKNSILQTTVTITVTCFFFPFKISKSFGFSSVQYGHDCHGFVG